MKHNFFSYFKPYKGLLVLDLVCAILIAASDLLLPKGISYIIDTVIPSGNLRLLSYISIGFLLIFIFRFLMDYIVTYYGHLLGVYMEYDMRRDLFSHMQKMSFKFYDETKAGHLMSRIISDLSEITELAHHGPEDILISVIMLIGSFLILVNINVSLTIVIFLLIPFLILFTFKLNIKMRTNFREVRKSVGDVNSQVEESILGIRATKAFTNEKHEEENFEKGNRLFRNLRGNVFKLMGVYSGGIYFFANVLTLVVLIYGGYLTINGNITNGELVAFFLYMGIMMGPIKKLAMFVDLYQRGMAGYFRYTEIMDVKPEIVDKSDAIVLSHVQGDITFKDLSFKYSDEEDYIINKLNLKIKAGESIGVVGPSGVGKTTLAHLLPRFYEIKEGRLLIDNHDIRDIKMSSLRQNIGVVAQETFLFSGTIFDNIVYGRLSASKEEVIEACKKAHIHDFIMSLPKTYETNIGERGVKLSGGQKQRVSIARIFLKNPPILIFDEATSALDNKSEKIVKDSMDELGKSRTTIVIAHRLSTIKKLNRIIYLGDNGIEEEGTHESLLANKGPYYELYMKGEF